ncbi:LOW QUALITY PROTEIN: hypothetical protein HID58_051520 [Brassica napus]|uniref:Uncharacterized protein n=1 Tax=Brassica napus TaxID=3708 RepID=A0ABQ8A9A4_BRANA|nr:LOW QUALITY PROTEIN: hypothetical protein HID58_051520 [Brassica napus]
MRANQQDASMALVPIESFSYSWLANFPSFEASIDDYHQTYEDSSSSSFIEMDPRLPPSRRFFINKAHESSFKFDTYVSFADDDHSLVHADEIFRDGYIKEISAGSSGGTGFDARITTLSRSRVYSEETTSSPRMIVIGEGLVTQRAPFTKPFFIARNLSRNKSEESIEKEQVEVEVENIKIEKNKQIAVTRYTWSGRESNL